MADATAEDASAESKGCESIWIELSNKVDNGRTSYEHAIASWQVYEKDCPDKPLYQMRLGQLKAFNRDFGGAREIARAIQPDSRERIQLEIVIARQNQIAAGHKDDCALTQEETLATRFPDWYIASLSYAQRLLECDAYAPALAAAKRSVELTTTAGGLRIIAIAGSLVGAYEDAAEAGWYATKLRPDWEGDPLLMLSIAESFRGLGEYKALTGTLVRLKRANPKASDLKPFKRLTAIANEKKG